MMPRLSLFTVVLVFTLPVVPGAVRASDRLEQDTISDNGVIREVAQIRGDDRRKGIMYTLLLKTTRSFLATDMASFQRVADSFKFIPIVP